MNILHNSKHNTQIAYHKYISSKKKAPYIIFHHGLMSGMESSKALYLEEYCKHVDYNYIRFDNYGHGSSSGLFHEQTITSWLEGLNYLIDNQITDNQLDPEILLIGSSMGCWITMLYAIKNPEKIKGLIGISAAPDFTEKLIWQKITDEQKKIMKDQGICDVQGTDPDCNYVYPISYKLITDARSYLLLDNEKININVPVHLIHSMNDIDVPYSFSMQLADKINHDNVVLKLVKGSNHGLSRPNDLKVICNSIEEILAVI